MADSIFVFEGSGSIARHTGNYFDYISEIALVKAPEKAVEKAAEKKPAQAKEKPLKFSYKEQREFESIDSDIADLEHKIEEMEGKIEKAATDFVKLQKLLEEKGELEEQLEFKMERWLYLNELREKIQAAKAE